MPRFEHVTQSRELATTCDHLLKSYAKTDVPVDVVNHRHAVQLQVERDMLPVAASSLGAIRLLPQADANVWRDTSGAHHPCARVLPLTWQRTNPNPRHRSCPRRGRPVADPCPCPCPSTWPGPCSDSTVNHPPLLRTPLNPQVLPVDSPSSCPLPSATSPQAPQRPGFGLGSVLPGANLECDRLGCYGNRC